MTILVGKLSRITILVGYSHYYDYNVYEIGVYYPFLDTSNLTSAPWKFQRQANTPTLGVSFKDQVAARNELGGEPGGGIPLFYGLSYKKKHKQTISVW